MANSTKVPKDFERLYAGMIALTDVFCRKHLNEEYALLARQAVAALCRKRPCPLLSGQPQTWACAVVYALGHVNFLSDRSRQPNLPMADICAHFGVAASTGANKAKVVRDLLQMHRFGHEWMLPSDVADSPMVWTIQVNGLLVDARRLPREIQEQAVRQGVLPFLPPDRDPRE